MVSGAKKMMHVPLPLDVYDHLRRMAKETRIPATTLARKAIREWLQQREKARVYQDIHQYAVAESGGEYEFDDDLAEASLEDVKGES
ncbi:MAG TPA: hypothetical protein PK014_14630 [Thermoanaerobaculia bacterium]|nr:hypothetical protein [Thermoanaerobaculia bacterium]HUM31275.1 hypothetical protein [Thermoanaerobaculia bacterium]HXK69629.1 hypothetical protein [Thermoanaerobaculia bacterium]